MQVGRVTEQKRPSGSISRCDPAFGQPWTVGDHLAGEFPAHGGEKRSPHLVLGQPSFIGRLVQVVPPEFGRIEGTENARGGLGHRPVVHRPRLVMLRPKSWRPKDSRDVGSEVNAWHVDPGQRPHRGAGAVAAGDVAGIDPNLFRALHGRRDRNDALGSLLKRLELDPSHHRHGRQRRRVTAQDLLEHVLGHLLGRLREWPGAVHNGGECVGEACQLPALEARHEGDV